APLAHLGLVLIGEGEVLQDDDDQRGSRSDRRENQQEIDSLRSQRSLRSTSWKSISGAEALKRAGLTPIALGPKEGLALINGTQPSTAVLALALAGADRLARAADIAAALSIDALRGSIPPFDPRVHAAPPYHRQAMSAANLDRPG